MNGKTAQPLERLGLLANGTSQRWEVAILESLDRDEWSMELESPRTYLIFQLLDLAVVREALHLLDSAGEETRTGEYCLVLGRFDSAAVSLIWDNEGFARCFLVVGDGVCSSLRLSFEKEDIESLSEALRQVVKDLPQANDRKTDTIRPLDSTEGDELTSELLESNPAFQALVAKSKASTRKPFAPASE